MKGSLDQFLSCPRLTINQDGRVRGTDGFDFLQNVLQRGALPNELPEIYFTPISYSMWNFLGDFAELADGAALQTSDIFKTDM